MISSNTTLLARNPDLISSEIDGELVMMNVDSGNYSAIGGVGTRVWALLEEPSTLDDIVAKLLMEFETDEATCRRDVVSFIDILMKDDIVREI